MTLFLNLRSMAVLSGARLSEACESIRLFRLKFRREATTGNTSAVRRLDWAAKPQKRVAKRPEKLKKVVPAPISSRFLCPRPPLLFSAPNQNRHATQATSFHKNYLKSFLGSVLYCVVILRAPPIRVASCNLNLAGNSFYCRSRTASDMTRYLLSSSSQKISTRKNLAREAADEKTVLASGARRRKRSSLDENSFLWSSLHQYINKQQPILDGNCLVHASPRAMILYFGSKRGRVTWK